MSTMGKVFEVKDLQSISNTFACVEHFSWIFTLKPTVSNSNLPFVHRVYVIQKRYWSRFLQLVCPFTVACLSIKMFLRCRPHHDHKSLEMCFWTRWSSIRLPTHTGNLIYRGWNETLQWFSITNSYTAPTKHLSIEWTLFCVRWVVNVYPSLIALMARYSHIIKGSCWAWKR